MRIATGGFHQETNRFGNVIITPEMVEEKTCHPENWYKRYKGTVSYPGALIEEAEKLGIEMVPTYYTMILPAGPATQPAYEAAKERLINAFCEEYEKQPYDGIAFTMHGAGMAEGHHDIEGEIAREVRQRLGKDIPAGIVLDLHGNISEELFDNTDVIVGLKCYPHTDDYEKSQVMLRLLHNIIKTGKRPGKKLIRLPWHITAAQGVTLAGAANDVMNRCIALEESDPELLNISFFHGFPYADVPMCGVSVIAYADTQQAAERCANKLASYAWEHRRDFDIPLYSAEQAIDHALEAEPGPVIINESSDNPGGGAPGVGTHLLRELIKRNVSSVYGFITDPEAAKIAAKAGVGATIDIAVGGKTDKFHGDPVEIKGAYVKCISHVKTRMKSPMYFGSERDYGLTACLEVGNVSVIVSSLRVQTMDDGIFIGAGVDWSQKRIIALKSSQHFKGWWKDKVKAIVPCESPGIQSADLSTFDFKYLDKNYYPLDPNAVWNG